MAPWSVVTTTVAVGAGEVLEGLVEPGVLEPRPGEGAEGPLVRGDLLEHVRVRAAVDEDVDEVDDDGRGGPLG